MASFLRLYLVAGAARARPADWSKSACGSPTNRTARGAGGSTNGTKGSHLALRSSKNGQRRPKQEESVGFSLVEADAKQTRSRVLHVWLNPRPDPSRPDQQMLTHLS